MILSEILCIATDFFAFVYNEYLILFCCDLEVDTIDIISERASRLENIPVQELFEEEEEEEKEEKDDKKDNSGNKNTNKSKDNHENVIVVDNYSFSIWWYILFQSLILNYLWIYLNKVKNKIN